MIRYTNMLTRPPSPGAGPEPFMGKLADHKPSAQLLEQLLNVARASALEEMASGIAHELNQPLGAIATFSQAGERMLIRPQPMVSSAVDVLRQINQAAMGAGDGLRRIRRLFNHSHGDRSAWALADVVIELEPVLELLAARAGVDLAVVLAPDLPRVLIDHRQIQHVLVVLVQNAIEAERIAGQRAAVRIETHSDGYTVQTDITDNGIGIQPEARPKVFHPFFTTKSGGTGLGVASSRTIIESHEGSIGFDDAAASGTRFWFKLPAQA